MSLEACVDSRSHAETQRLGAELGRALQAGDVVGVRGELGAGKTCLVQGIARGLEVPPEIPVTSPTFTLVGEYPGRLPLRHADFYRVESYARLHGAGFEDLLDGEGVLVVEWPELFPDALPPERLAIRIEVVSDEVRRVCFGGRGDRARALTDAIAGKVLTAWR
jgi:tRNA threonylcarbamoyladenosine biosynthesis protein TsaE